MKTASVIKQIAKGVGLAGAFGLIVVAPNAALAFDKLVKMYNKKTKDGYNDYLKRSGYFTAQQQEDKYVIRLTEKGNKIFANSQLSDYDFPKNKWDGNWYLLMFDIPETHRNVRVSIVSKLKELGMRQVQNSVYVHYLPTQELAKIIRTRYPYISSLIVAARADKIDGQDQLKKAFNLN